MIDKVSRMIYNTIKFEYHKNDYDEDGRIVKPFRELPGGARQWRNIPMTYHL